MERYTRLFILALLMVLPGCTGLRAVVVPPPTYDDQCVPSNLDYLEWANDEQDLFDVSEISSDPEVAHQQALDEIERLGLRLVIKPETGNGQFDGFSTTLPDTIFLSAGWEKRTTASKAATLWHELVHKKQWDRLGRERFLARYAVAAGRWSIEVPAYKMSVRINMHFGADYAWAEKYAPARADKLYEAYALGGSMPECTKQTSIDIWLAEAAEIRDAP